MRNNAKGFTFIELMVVLLIIGITLHFASQSWGDFGEKRRVITAAELLKMQIIALQNQSLFAGSAMGLKVDTTSYKIVYYDQSKGWVVPTGLHIPTLPRHIILHAQTNPAVIIDAQGNINQFKVNIGTINRPYTACVIGTKNNEIKIKVDCR